MEEACEPRSGGSRDGLGSGPVSGKRWRWLVALGLVAVVAHAPGLGGVFIFDDHVAIVENPALESLAVTSPPGNPLAGRPLVVLSFSLNVVAGGGTLEPFGFHLVNLALHVVNAFLLFMLLEWWVARLPGVAHLRPSGLRVAAAGITAIWAAHPLSVDSVTYLTQRTELLCSLGYLVLLVGYVRADRSRGWAITSVVGGVIGLLSKEVIVTAPLIALLLDRAFLATSWREVFRRRRLLHLAYAAIAAGVLAITATGPRAETAGFHTDVTVLDYLLAQSEVVLSYLRTLVWPLRPIFDYGEARPVSFADVWPFTVTTALLCLASIELWRRSPPWGFFALWYWVLLAPSSSFVPILTEVGAERRVYLAMVGPLVLLIGGAVRWARLRKAGELLRVGEFGAVLTIVVPLGVVLCTVRTALWSATFQEEIGPWLASTVARPEVHRAWYNAGILAIEAGETHRGRELLTRAVELDPRAIPSSRALAVVCLRQRDFARALRVLRDGGAATSDDPEFAFAFARAAEAMGRGFEAHDAYRRCLEHLERVPAAQRNWYELQSRVALGWLGATHPDRRVRGRGDPLVDIHAAIAVSNANPALDNAACVDAWAAAVARQGEPRRAVQILDRLLPSARANYAPETIRALEARRALYASGQPYTRVVPEPGNSPQDGLRPDL